MPGQRKTRMRQIAAGKPLRPRQKLKHSNSRNKAELKNMAKRGASRKELREGGLSAAEAAVLDNEANTYQPTELDRRLVEEGVAFGFTHVQILEQLEHRNEVVISMATFRIKFKREIAISREALVMEAGRAVVRKMRNGSESAARFILERRGNWNSTTQLADPSGRPLQPPKINIQFVDAEGDANEKPTPATPITNPLRKCKGCQHLFIARAEPQVYCDLRCWDVFTTSEHRKHYYLKVKETDKWQLDKLPRQHPLPTR